MNSVTPDTGRLLAAQGVRASAYGFGAVLLGTWLEDRGLPGWQVGLVLGAMVAGTALMSVLVARFADRIGRRRFYGGLYLVLGVVGVILATAGPLWLLGVAALTGVLSTELIESGPFTSLEQPMLASALPSQTRVHGFGRYNAVAAAAGSVGALLAAIPGVLGGPDEQRWFLVFIPVAAAGAVAAWSLSNRVEPSAPVTVRGHLTRSRPAVLRLASPSTPSAAGSPCRRSSPTGCRPASTPHRR